MADAINIKVRKGKATVREELENRNVVFVIRQLNNYYRSKLYLVHRKGLHGLEASDFSANVLLKIVSGSRSWENSRREDFMDFVMDVARSELNGWWENGYVPMVGLDVRQENKSNLHIRDDYYGF